MWMEKKGAKVIVVNKFDVSSQWDPTAKNGWMSYKKVFTDIYKSRGVNIPFPPFFFFFKQIAESIYKTIQLSYGPHFLLLEMAVRFKTRCKTTMKVAHITGELWGLLHHTGPLAPPRTAKSHYPLCLCCFFPLCLLLHSSILWVQKFISFIEGNLKCNPIGEDFFEFCCCVQYAILHSVWLLSHEKQDGVGGKY